MIYINAMPSWCHGVQPITDFYIVTNLPLVSVFESFSKRHNCDVPKELDENALMDGCNRFQAFRHITIPVMSPGGYNNWFIFIPACLQWLCSYSNATKSGKPNYGAKDRQLPGSNSTRRPRDVGSCSSRINHGTSFCAVMFLQRQIVSGLTAGAVKG